MDADRCQCSAELKTHWERKTTITKLHQSRSAVPMSLPQSSGGQCSDSVTLQLCHEKNEQSCTSFIVILKADCISFWGIVKQGGGMLLKK